MITRASKLAAIQKNKRRECKNLFHVGMRVITLASYVNHNPSLHVIAIYLKV
jgi:hypothetical protein